MRRESDAGVALINVLVMLALTASVVYAMLNLAELSLGRSQGFSEAAQALALVRAGEQSAIVSLRRDLREAPETDHAGEAWAAIAQATVEIAGGSFALQITDAQDRFNLNDLAGGGLLGLQVLQAIVRSLGLPPETSRRIVSAIALGPVETPGALFRRAGLRPEDVAALAPYVTALPGRAEINANAASVEMLEVVFGNPLQARLAVSIRERRGGLTRRELDTARILLPPGVGLRSDHFRLRTTAAVGGTALTMESLLQRRTESDGTPRVVVVRRSTPAADRLPPPDAPS